MKTYDGYLIDLDGTMYSGQQEIPAAQTFIKRLHHYNMPHLFVTNNSARTPEATAEKLRSLAIPATAENILTSSMTTARLLAAHGLSSVYIIGEDGLQEAVRQQGLTVTADHPDAVVIGIDRQINYDKLSKALLALQAGARFYSTNADVVIPDGAGFLPGNGSLTAVLSTAIGCQPFFIGKPEAYMLEDALTFMQCDASRVLMVGDNYDTDIRAGMNAGLDTLLVHTGVTTKAMLRQHDQQPTYTIDSLADWQVLVG